MPIKTQAAASFRQQNGMSGNTVARRAMPAREFAGVLNEEHASDLERAFGLRWRVMFPDLAFDTEHQL